MTFPHDSPAMEAARHSNPQVAQELVYKQMNRMSPPKYKLEPLIDRIVPKWRPQVNR